MIKSFCEYHEAEPATSSVMFEGGGVLYVCAPCLNKVLIEHPHGWVCKFCSVPIISNTDFRAIKGNHKNGCVRRMAE